jgi:hypothetical protein
VTDVAREENEKLGVDEDCNVFLPPLVAYTSIPAMPLLMFMAWPAMVPHHLRPSYHSSYGKETQHFGSNHSKGDHLLSIGVAETAQHDLGCVYLRDRAGV